MTNSQKFKTALDKLKQEGIQKTAFMKRLEPPISKATLHAWQTGLRKPSGKNGYEHRVQIEKIFPNIKAGEW